MQRFLRPKPLQDVLCAASRPRESLTVAPEQDYTGRAVVLFHCKPGEGVPNQIHLLD